MHANVAGCVLNDVNTKRGFGYYSTQISFGKYGYSRYNRYRAKDERTSEDGTAEKSDVQ